MVGFEEHDEIVQALGGCGILSSENHLFTAPDGQGHDGQHRSRIDWSAARSPDSDLEASGQYSLNELGGGARMQPYS